jgi:hypothetical protein
MKTLIFCDSLSGGTEGIISFPGRARIDEIRIVDDQNEPYPNLLSFLGSDFVFTMII